MRGSTRTQPRRKVRILLATDAAGEGIDLQHHCHRLVNFDIPFNPNRLEQRIGRIDRYGQTQTPEVRHFAPVAGDANSAAGTGRRDARPGGRQGRLGSCTTSARRTRSSRPTSSVSWAASTCDRPGPGRRRTPSPESCRASGLLNADLTRLEQDLATSRDKLHLRPANLQRVVEIAFELNKFPPMELVGSDRTDAPVFRLPSLGAAWEPVTRGLYTRLDPTHPRPIAFDPAGAHGGPGRRLHASRESPSAAHHPWAASRSLGR